MAKAKRGIGKRTSDIKAAAFNHNAQWKVYRQFEMKVHKALEKFRNDVERNAGPEIISKDQNSLLLLMGECNYMAQEYTRMSGRGRSR